MTDIVEIRNRINEIDNQIIELLAQRNEQAIKVAEFKYENARPVKDSARELAHTSELMQRAEALGVSPSLVSTLYDSIYSYSVADQIAHVNKLSVTHGNDYQKLKIAFLGDKGTYSYLATYKYFKAFGNNIEEKNCKSFLEIINSVEQGIADYAVIPIENTSTGCINEVYDLLQDAKVHIVGELTYPIEHCLLSVVPTDLSKIKTVYAHPQPLSQCSNWLQANLPNAELKPCSSSSAAMKVVQELSSEEAVAIGCEASGKIYNEIPLFSKIANQKLNVTRFIVVAANSISVPKDIPAKTSIIFTTDNKPGALVEVLQIFSKRGINIVKLQSRPRSPSDISDRSAWAEMFYADIQSNVDTVLMQTILKELEGVTGIIKVLG